MEQSEVENISGSEAFEQSVDNIIDSTSQPDATDSLGQVSDHQNSDASENDWTTDKRYNDMWGQDPNKLYNSYKELESKFTPQSQQLSELQTQVSEFEKQVSELQGIQEQYSVLNDFYSGLSPEHQNQLNAFLSELEMSQIRQQYGENLPDDVIAKMREVDMMKAEMEAQKQESQKQELMRTIDSQLDDVKQFAEQNSIDYDEQELLNYCNEQNVPVNLVAQVFKAQALPQIQKLATSRAQETTIQNLNKSKAGLLPSRSKTIGQKMSKMSLDQRLSELIPG